MHQIEDSDMDLRRKIRSPCDVGLMEEIIARRIVHSTRVVDLKYTVHNRYILLEMFVKILHVSIRH